MGARMARIYGYACLERTQAMDLRIRWVGARACQGFGDTPQIYTVVGCVTYLASDFEMFASWKLESWLGRSQARDLGLRLAAGRTQVRDLGLRWAWARAG